MGKKWFSTEFFENEKMQKRWGWFVLLGILLILLGVGVIGSAFVSTPSSVFGFLLISAGIVNVVQSVLASEWRGVFLSLLLAVLYVILGLLWMVNPTTAIFNITFLIAAFCGIAGFFKMATSYLMRFEKWKWIFFNGLITFILGCLIYFVWPQSALWMIGAFVGVDMILSGWSWIVLSLSGRKAQD